MTMMKKRLSHFAYNERSRSGWTLSISLQNLLSPIRSTTMKTVTYVLGTFVTLVPGPNKGGYRGICVRLHLPRTIKFFERTSETPQKRRFPCFLPLSLDESCSDAYYFTGSLKKSGLIPLDCRRQFPCHCREQSVFRWHRTKKPNRMRIMLQLVDFSVTPCSHIQGSQTAGKFRYH